FARPSKPGEFIVGREAILASFLARPPRAQRHVIANTVVDVEGPATARAFSVIVLYQGDPSPEGELPTMSADSPIIGTFTDRLALTEDGWRFTERVGGLDFKS
ncbi:MAG: nuclear transport factor 2 family protein, partial [Croceibacterium sp.]